MAAALEHRVPQSSAWAELNRFTVDTHPCAETLGEPEQVLVVAAPDQLTAAGQELQQQASLGRRDTGLVCQAEYPQIVFLRADAGALDQHTLMIRSRQKTHLKETSDPVPAAFRRRDRDLAGQGIQVSNRCPEIRLGYGHCRIGRGANVVELQELSGKIPGRGGKGLRPCASRRVDRDVLDAAPRLGPLWAVYSEKKHETKTLR